MQVDRFIPVLSVRGEAGTLIVFPSSRQTIDRPVLTMTGLDTGLRGGWLLPTVLRTTAGAVDVIGFLARGGLFTAHITGNVVVVAVHYVTGGFSEVGPLLAVLVFIAVLSIITLASVAAEKAGHGSRRAPRPRLSAQNRMPAIHALGRRHQGVAPDTISEASSPFRTNWTEIPARTSRSATRQTTGPNDARRWD